MNNKQLNDKTDQLPDLTEVLLKHTKLKGVPSLQKGFSMDQLLSKETQQMIPQIFQEFFPSNIFDFLYDVAKEYIKAYKDHTSLIYSKKVEQDFLTVCMLNALFGDPRIHLVQLHPSYQAKHGLRNFDKTLRLY